MASQGPNYTGWCTDDGGIDSVWYLSGYTDNLAGVGGHDAMVDCGPGATSMYSNYLGGGSCSFAIPSDATINGIVVEMYAMATYKTYGRKMSPSSVKIVKAGSVVGTEHVTDPYDTYDTVYAWRSYGSSTDLWGTTWTAAQINANGASGFGAVLQVWNYDNAYMNTVTADAFRITVYYTEAGKKFCAVLCSKFDGVTFSKFDGVA